MDEQENKPDILSKIFDKAGQPASPPQERPKFEYPPDDEPSPPPSHNGPGENSGAAAKLLPWLCMVLGAALLVLGICLLQLARMNQRLESLEETVQSVALIDQLQRENKILQQELEKLEESVQQATWRTRELEQENQAVYAQYYAEQDKEQQLNRLWYLSRFMEAGDYLIASALVRFSSGSNSPEGGCYNSAQVEQYRTYAQELIERGYLEETDEFAAINETLSLPLLAFTERWDPDKNHDAAAMSLLWCALEAHFIHGTGSDEAAAQYLYLYPLGDPSSGYPDRVNRLASPFTLEQFELMKQDLVESENLAIADNGDMSVGPGFHFDVLYTLPFHIPPS